MGQHEKGCSGDAAKYDQNTHVYPSGNLNVPAPPKLKFKSARDLSMEDSDLSESFDDLLKSTDPPNEAALKNTTEVPETDRNGITLKPLKLPRPVPILGPVVHHAKVTLA